VHISYIDATNLALKHATAEEKTWDTVYNTLFDSPSDLELFRQFREQILSKTAKGRIYRKLLYKISEKALGVFFNNHELMLEAHDLIQANIDSVSDVLDGYEGIIYNTDGIFGFLDAYASKAPLIMNILAYIVKRDMLRKQRRDDLFFGFRLK
jgi:hypothetical protein